MIGERLDIREIFDHNKEKSNENCYSAHSARKLPVPGNKLSDWILVFFISDREHDQPHCDHCRPPAIKHMLIHDQLILFPGALHRLIILISVNGEFSSIQIGWLVTI